MKLRIKGNSIRLRLSQTEVEKFNSDGLVKDKMEIGDSTLTYLLELVNEKNVTARYDFNTIRIGVPEGIKLKWMHESEVGFEATVKSSEGIELYVLVEKDFQCLIPRKEDESDLFENPMSR